MDGVFQLTHQPYTARRRCWHISDILPPLLGDLDMCCLGLQGHPDDASQPGAYEHSLHQRDQLAVHGHRQAPGGQAVGQE